MCYFSQQKEKETTTIKTLTQNWPRHYNLSHIPEPGKKVDMIAWTTQRRKISELKDLKKNPRKLSKDQEEQLRISLDKFGLIDKIIINLDGTIIGGHQRKRTLRKMGIKEVECMVPERELTEKEVEELSIRLNKAQGSWDWDELANLFEASDLIEWGFTCEELFDSSASQIASMDDEEDQTKEEKESKKCPHCGKEID